MSTKKHFKQAAETLLCIPNLKVRAERAEILAGEFMRQNPRFNRPRFMEACGLPRAVKTTFPAVRCIVG